MLDKTQLKAQGIRFGKAFQAAFKTAIIYGVEHASAAGNMQSTFNALNTLVKQTQTLAIGFLNGRFVINNIFSNDPALDYLETEFGKRGVAVITFEAGITLGRFKKALGVIATKEDIIEQQGGIWNYLEQHPLESARIMPAPKNQAQTPEELLMQQQSESESSFLQKELLEMEPAAGSRGLQYLLESVGMVRPQDLGGSAGEILDLAGKSVQASLSDPKKDPREALGALTHMLDELRPDFLLAGLPEQRRGELLALPKRDMAAELMEDMAVGWATRRLSMAPTGPEIVGVEQEVVKVLARSMKATMVAERVMKKLNTFLRDANLPKESYERIQRSLAWVKLSLAEQYERLKTTPRPDHTEFRWMEKFVEDCVNQRKLDLATDIVGRYFAILENPPIVIPEEMARSHGMLKQIVRHQTAEFARQLTDKLCASMFSKEHFDSRAHKEITKCLLTIAHSAVLYEDYGLVQKIGQELERSLVRGRSVHEFCCAEALMRLVVGSSVERLVELYVEKKEDAAWAKVAAYLLRLAGPPGVEKIFLRLETENDAAVRMRLVRLLGQSGEPGIKTTRQRLNHERWYVVRNAVNVLADLKDPELVHHLSVTLRHPDERVQQAAAAVIMKSRDPRRGEALAHALPHMKSHVLEKVLEELHLLRDPGSLPGLQEFLLQTQGAKPAHLEKALQMVVSFKSHAANEVLAKVLFQTDLPMTLRRSALITLSTSKDAGARALMSQFAKAGEHDPLAAECRNFLKVMAG